MRLMPNWQRVKLAVIGDFDKVGAEWDAFATAHAKSGTFKWIAVTIIYQWWTGALVSLATLLMILPGMFLGCFAAVPVAIIDWQKRSHLLKVQRGGRRLWWPLFVWTAWIFVKLAYEIALPILTIRLLRRIGL
jgi:hypothetical protein